MKIEQREREKKVKSKWSHPHQSALPHNNQCTRLVFRCSTPVELLNNGQVGDECFVHCSEVVPSSQVVMYGQCLRGRNVGRGRTVCPLYVGCPLFRVSIHGGSTLLHIPWVERPSDVRRSVISVHSYCQEKPPHPTPAVGPIYTEAMGLTLLTVWIHCVYILYSYSGTSEQGTLWG